MQARARLGPGRGAGRRSLFAPRAALLGLLSGLVGGCSHHCGYLDASVRLIYTPARDRAWPVPGSEQLRVVQAPTRDAPVLRLRAEQNFAVSRSVIKAYYGRPARTHYWSYIWAPEPIFKPLIWATVVLPWYFPYADPHYHDGIDWRIWDYLRDVVAWYNVFEAFPHARWELGEPVEFHRQRSFLAQTVETRPLVGRRIEVSSGGRAIAALTTGSDGEAEAQLGEPLRQSGDGALTVRCKLVGAFAAVQDVVVPARDSGGAERASPP